MASFTTCFLLFCLALISLTVNAIKVTYDGKSIMLDGEKKLFISGSIHYPRSTAEMWPSLIKKAKEGGLDVIETYVFWDIHEPQRRQYDFSGNRDLVKFIKTIQQEGLYAFLRIGPYVCAEWNYGGFPVWLHNLPNSQLRTNNTVFMNEMSTFTSVIVDMMRDEKLFASQGGPIIFAQIENEYGNVMQPYGDDGKQYIEWCARLADSYQIGIPWVMCQQANPPAPIVINTCNGWYCDQFYPSNKNAPKMWTENWTGWFKNWGGKHPHRTAEDVAFAVARFFQYGGSLQNYYMYHGGTNFGRTTGGPYITTSYDYDAPLDEYGNLNQPKWGHLKHLHYHIKSMEKILTYGTSTHIDYGNMVDATVYSYHGKSACFLGNANSTSDATINFGNTIYTVPAWSVTLLPDCYTEAFNTAKVSAQTSIMVKKSVADDGDEPRPLEWEWTPEPFKQTKNGQVVGTVSLTAPQLLEQKSVTNDTSDYLYYITSVEVKKDDPLLSQGVKLRVHTSGHVLLVFVNGRHLGSKFAQYGNYEFTYESEIKLREGKNEITLLSSTVGLANYGAFFDTINVGILGPVQLVAANGTVISDLSKNKWMYKVGIHGEHEKLYNSKDSQGWYKKGLRANSPFIWYKTNFKTPAGTDPVVVDLMGLGKGQAWVNGNSIGRYWPSYLADENGCTATCNYRGPYGSSKCLSKCGQPSQRWYHVPRSFLNENNNDNTLILFEELGGDPHAVRFSTVTVGTACGHAYEGHKLQLSCQGENVISEIKFVSFGLPKGECGSFEKGPCESHQAFSVVKKRCLGHQSCEILVKQNMLGSTKCKGGHNRLAVEAVCGPNAIEGVKKKQ